MSNELLSRSRVVLLHNKQTDKDGKGIALTILDSAIPGGKIMIPFDCVLPVPWGVVFRKNLNGRPGVNFVDNLPRVADTVKGMPATLDGLIDVVISTPIPEPSPSLLALMIGKLYPNANSFEFVPELINSMLCVLDGPSSEQSAKDFIDCIISILNNVRGGSDSVSYNALLEAIDSYMNPEVDSSATIEADSVPAAMDGEALPPAEDEEEVEGDTPEEAYRNLEPQEVTDGVEVSELAEIRDLAAKAAPAAEVETAGESKPAIDKPKTARKWDCPGCGHQCATATQLENHYKSSPTCRNAAGA